jgi:hypothetical protein
MITKELGKIGSEVAHIHFFNDPSEVTQKGFPAGTQCYWTVGSAIISSPMQFVERIRVASAKGESVFNTQDTQRVARDIHSALMEYQNNMIKDHFDKIVEGYHKTDLPNKADIIQHVRDTQNQVMNRNGAIDPDGVYRDQEALKEFIDGQE